MVNDNSSPNSHLWSYEMGKANYYCLSTDQLAPVLLCWPMFTTQMVVSSPRCLAFCSAQYFAGAVNCGVLKSQVSVS